MRPDTRLQLMKLLRYFGHLISDIFLNYDENIPTLTYTFRYDIEQYVAKYCSETLTHLKLVARPKILFDDGAVRFTKVKTMKICEGYSLTLNSVPFAECFPNLYGLAWNTHSDIKLWPETITACLPSLRSLNISKYECGGRSRCPCDAIMKFWQLNPQLTKLELNHDPDKCCTRILPRIRDLLPNLKILKLTTSSLYSCCRHDEIHLENVVDLRLHLLRGCSIIPFQFTKLESFCVTYYCKQGQTAVSTFIERNEHLKSLHMSYCRNTSDLTKMIPILTDRIENLTITDYAVPSSEFLYQLLTNIRSMRTLSLVTRNYDPSLLSDLIRSKICEQKKCNGVCYVTITNEKMN